MAVDKLVDSTQLNSDLTSVANAIRTKGGTSSSLAFPSGFVSAVNAIDTSGTDFIVTLTYNSQSDIYEPDCTYSELYTAYQAGKYISFEIYSSDPTAPQTLYAKWYFDSVNSTFVYSVADEDGNGVDEYWVKTYFYNFSSTGVTAEPDQYTYYDSSDGDALAGNVLSGKVFYNDSGRAVGTMPLGTTGTPIATKGTVNNHSISVTPSVTNTTGYITGSTINGTAVSVSASELVSGTKSITANGTGIDVTNYANVDVTITPNYQQKTVNPSTSTQVITADTGSYDALSQVTVNAMPSGSATTPATTITANPSITVGNDGLITASVSGTQNITPTVSAGYVASGTAGTITVSGSNTSQLTTQAAQTITPTTTDQTIASGTYLTGAQTISGDANLVAGNIKKNVSIFNVTGTYEGSGGGGLEEKDVNFIDYDGTLLYSYTAVEAQALSALPSNPSHTGLTAQGWNWTLAQIKTQLTNYPNSIVWVGQMYKTSDGKTRIYIDIPADANSYSFTVYFKQSVARGVTVDWGDGSTTQTFTGTTATERSHTYASSGQYIITLEVTSGTITFSGASNYSIFGNSGSNAYSFKYGRITKIEFDDDAIIDGGYIFEYCYGLQEIVLPSGITAFGNSLFCDCKNLKAIILPDTVTSIGNSAFVNCINLQRVSIPYGVSSIGNNTFKGCSIKSITLSNSLTSIGGSAFYECRELDSIIVPINANPAATSSTYIFSGCTKLNSIVMYSFTSLPNYFLQNCTNLKKITLPNNLTSIGTYVFNSCNYIESLTIPSGVTSIGSASFSNCFSIKTLICLPTTPPTLPNTAFSPSDLKIVVPYSADHSVLQAYKTATNWVTYQSRMVEAEP